MSDYISREAAFYTLTACYHHTTDIQHGMLRWVLGKVPAANVAEVRHGHWTNKERYHGTLFGDCSNCGISSVADAYCSNCGAKMDEEEGKE